MAGASWFVLIDPADKGKPASYLDSVDFVLQFQPGTPDYNTLQSGGVINPQGENLIKWKGPYQTEAEAKQAQNPQPSPENPVAPVVTGIENLSGVSGLFGVLDAGYRQVTKASMWRSVGWLVLGTAMMGGGIYWWAQTEGTRGIQSLAEGKKPRLTAPVLPLMLMMIGLYLDWFAIKYWEDTTTIWPSDPLKAILQGKGLPARSEDTSAASLLNTSESAAATSSGSVNVPGIGSDSATVPAGVSGSEQQQAQSLFSGHGWLATQLPALVSLWNQESGWNPKAKNPGSGAYGIAQALGHGVPGGAASDGTNEYGGYGLSTAQAQAANSGVAYWQIVWGLNYIASRYGSPQAAWSHEVADDWY